MAPIAIFTDASRITFDDDTHSTAFGWLALNMIEEDPKFAVPRVREMTEYKNSTMHAEIMAIWDAAMFYKDHDEVHIFTDSLYPVRHVRDYARLFEPDNRPLRVYPELLQELHLMSNIHLHHVRAHKSLFYNELVDQMVGFVARGESDAETAENWGREAFKKGVIELTIVKGRKPKYVRKAHERNSEVLSTAINASIV